MISDQSPDVVLMDIKLPGINGIEATRRITAGGSAQVVVLTIHEADRYRADALEAGACAFVTKRMHRELQPIIATLLATS